MEQGHLIAKMLFLREHKCYMCLHVLYAPPNTFLGRIDKPLFQIFDLASHI